MIVHNSLGLERYLNENPTVKEAYIQILKDDCKEYELDEEETKKFIEECAISIPHFEMFMPQDYEKFQKISHH